MKEDMFIKITAEIVASYVGHNNLSTWELPQLIRNTYKTLVQVAGDREEGRDFFKPAVPVDESVFPDYIICLESGKRFKSLKKHLRTQYGLSPEAYRAKWNLKPDYPMIAPNYSKQRSELAKQIKLGLNV